MLDRRFFAEGTAIVVLAVLCASVSNFAAARDRKVAWVGNYPRALQIPEKATSPDPVVTDLVVTDLVVTDPATATATETTTVLPTETATATAAPVPVATTTVAPDPSAAPLATSTSPAPQVKLPTGLQSRPRKAFPPHPNVAAVEITNEDAMQLWHEKAIFIDARRTDVYNSGHVKGARSMPVWEADIDDRVRDFFNEVTDQQQPIVVYCTGGNCEDSHMLADKLWGAGFENVLVHTDGFPGWQKIGGAVE